MSSGGVVPGGKNQQSTGVDWDSVLNLTMMDIRTKVPRAMSNPGRSCRGILDNKHFSHGAAGHLRVASDCVLGPLFRRDTRESASSHRARGASADDTVSTSITQCHYRCRGAVCSINEQFACWQVGNDPIDEHVPASGHLGFGLQGAVPIHASAVYSTSDSGWMADASQFSKETVQLAAEFIDSMPYNERYPLHYAIYILDMEQVKDLLTEYSTINERDSSYWTPLHIACLIGSKGEKETRAQVPHTDSVALYHLRRCDCPVPQVVMVRLLLSLGADIDARDMFGRTPLWIAINKGFVTHHFSTAI